MKMIVIGIILCFWIATTFVSGGGDKVRLTDIQVLTLYAGKMTSYRRTSAIPQLNCVGGSSGCQYKPQVVQCYNRGSDGFDVQWECKADLDKRYRFGRIEVVCEGYDYPEDKYVLRGSCGLEYTIDLTKGHSYQEQSHHNYYGKESQYSYIPSYKKGSSGFGHLLVLVVVGIVVYAIYKTCLTSQYQNSPTDDDSTPYDNPGRNGGGGGWYSNFFGGNGRNAQPPPYGFRQEHYNAGCGGARQQNPRNNFGGFWTGAATGGLLGYMFGNRNRGYNQGYRASQPGWGSFNNNSSSGGSSATYSSFGSSSDSGTRTASGFGGTRRR